VIFWQVFVWEIVLTVDIFPSLIHALTVFIHVHPYVCWVLELVGGDSVDWREWRLQFRTHLCGPKRLGNEW
jgi:hypothetical protein